MNNDRRKALNALISKVEEIKSDLENLQSQEQDYVDNMPENLQGSEKYEKASEAADNLQSAVDACDEVIENINNSIEA